MNKLWKCSLKVSRGSFDELPGDWLGAFVNFYAGAPSYEDACSKAVSIAESMGMEFVELSESKLVEIDPKDWWDEYVLPNYPEISDSFPSQEEILDIVERGMVFHGPFAGWKNESDI